MTRAPRRILCPVALTPNPSLELRASGTLASVFGAHVIVLHVLPAVAASRGEPEVPDRVHAMRVLADLVAELPASADATTMVGSGPMVACILDVAQQSATDLVVIGDGLASGDRTSIARVVVDVVRGAPCPVVYVPTRLRDDFEIESPPRRLLCAIDFSVASIMALAQAMAWTQASPASVTLLHVLEDLRYTSSAPWSRVVVDGRSEAHADALKKLAELVAMGWKPGSEPTTIVREGDVPSQILALADEVQADTVVLGTHKRSRIGTLLFGSVVAKILEGSRCPVLLAC